MGLGQYRKDCSRIGRDGITASEFVQRLSTPVYSSIGIISLGANDDDLPNLRRNLNDARLKVHSERVYWLLPGNKPEVRTAIRDVAVQFDDFLVDTSYEVSSDHYHLTTDGYRFLATVIP
jgi:hypothetical protein